ncbi:baseplate J/gp47 family protein [bacterium]|nr:baseplate J/gp47 family protein [bacterium]
MEIINNDIISDSAEDITEALKAELKNEFGSELQIKDSGILGSLLNLAAEIEDNYSNILEYFTEQFNPETAESVWQDAIYERLGVSRLKESYTSFSKEVEGTPNCTIKAKSILIRSASDGYEFTNLSEQITDNRGICAVEFTALKPGKITVKSDEDFAIVKIPAAVNKLCDTPVITLKFGKEKESDNHYKIRFRNSKAIKSKAAHRAVISSLCQYTDDIKFLKIIDRNTNSETDAGCVEIYVKHNTTDSVFAQAVMDTFGCGIKFLGADSVTVKDVKGVKVDVKFTNAEEVPICVKISMTIESGEHRQTVINRNEESILNYVKQRVFGLGSSVYATEFIPCILDTEGSVSIEEIKIKRFGDAEYTDILHLNNAEIPVFKAENIYINRQEEVINETD